MSQTTYFNIISGRTPGVVGTFARLALMVLSGPYAAVVCVRNYLYTTGRLKAYRGSVPVICVGNLTTGGTGKTPLVVWLCRYLREKQMPVTILTRGYKTQPGTLSDEPALLADQCPGVAVVVNPDRVAGAAEAIQHHGAKILVMDDGFQHRRLARDLDIVVIDATQPFGYGRLLPAGLLREPLTALRRAHAVVLTRCNQVSEDALRQIEEDVRRINGDLVLARSSHVPVAIRTYEGAEISLEALRGTQVFAFCGIGNPLSFFYAIERLEGVLVGSKTYEDHYRYRPADLEQIHREAATREAALILTTQKDWTKIACLTRPRQHPRLAYLAVELQIIAGVERLTALIDHVLGGTMPRGI